MKIGTRQFCINPEFPVNRMLKPVKHQDVSDPLHCRIVIFVPENDVPIVHVSIDTVELWKYRENQITEVIERVLGQKVHCICSATHSHNCPCMTTDDDYVDFVLTRLKHEVPLIELKDYKKVEYNYQYNYFDKVGKSRVMDHTTPHVYAETCSIYGDGKRIVTFLIHNVHPTIKELWKGDFTAEYPGYCISALRKEYPDEFFTFLLGPSGDISPHFVRRGRDYEEMLRLSELLKQEFARQLKLQKKEKNQSLHMEYEETVIPNLLEPFDLNQIDLPEVLNEDEKKFLERLGKPSPFHREIRDFEKCAEHTLAHLIFSKEYSMIFEPFELYSEYYGAVDKRRCSVISISKGFDHYLTGLHLNRLTMHGTASGFSHKTKKRMWEILSRWSCQEKV
ncbi:MAG: hypothetical protein IJ356_00995 [Erysipelotrichaceae bacterium]|nr:hypothetical protein [Erysipelotrichaceae bacterium]